MATLKSGEGSCCRLEKSGSLTNTGKKRIGVSAGSPLELRSEMGDHYLSRMKQLDGKKEETRSHRGSTVFQESQPRRMGQMKEGKKRSVSEKGTSGEGDWSILPI